MKRCQSCGKLIELLEDFAGLDQSSNYCSSCADDSGKIKSFEEVLDNLTQRIAKTDGFDESASRNAALQILGRQPAWEPRFKREENVKKTNLYVVVTSIAVVVAIVASVVTFAASKKTINAGDKLELGFILSNGADPFAKVTQRNVGSITVNEFQCKGDQVTSSVKDGLITIRSMEDIGSVYNLGKNVDNIRSYKEDFMQTDRNILSSYLPLLSTYWTKYTYDATSKKGEKFLPENTPKDTILKKLGSPIVYEDENPYSKAIYILKDVVNGKTVKNIGTVEELQSKKNSIKWKFITDGILETLFVSKTKSEQVFSKGNPQTDIQESKYLYSDNPENSDDIAVKVPFRQPKFFDPKTGQTKTLPVDLEKPHNYIFDQRYFVSSRMREANNATVPLVFNVRTLVIDKQNIQDNMKQILYANDLNFEKTEEKWPTEDIVLYDMQTGKSKILYSVSHKFYDTWNSHLAPEAITEGYVYFSDGKNMFWVYDIANDKVQKLVWPFASKVSQTGFSGQKIIGLLSGETKKNTLIVYDIPTQRTTEVDTNVSNFWVSNSKDENQASLVYEVMRENDKGSAVEKYISLGKPEAKPVELFRKQLYSEKKVLSAKDNKVVWCQTAKADIDHPLIKALDYSIGLILTSFNLEDNYRLEENDYPGMVMGDLYLTDTTTNKTTKLDEGLCWAPDIGNDIISWVKYNKDHGQSINVCWTKIAH